MRQNYRGSASGRRAPRAGERGPAHHFCFHAKQKHNLGLRPVFLDKEGSHVREPEVDGRMTVMTKRTLIAIGAAAAVGREADAPDALGSAQSGVSPPLSAATWAGLMPIE